MVPISTPINKIVLLSVIGVCLMSISPLSVEKEGGERQVVFSSGFILDIIHK